MWFHDFLRKKYLLGQFPYCCHVGHQQNQLKEYCWSQRSLSYCHFLTVSGGFFGKTVESAQMLRHVQPFLILTWSLEDSFAKK
jgi:hypothetical protein